MLKTVFLVSGGGSNLQAVIDEINRGAIVCDIRKVISSDETAYAIKRAEENGIRTEVIHPKHFPDNKFFYEALIESVKQSEAELIVLAGYLPILGKSFIDAFKYQIINIHPSLIPSFCGKGCYGLKVHEMALKKGVKVTGATVHFVDYGTDTGPIILQKAIDILPEDTPESLQQRVMAEAEWILLPKAIQLFAEGRIIVKNNIVYIKEAVC